MKRIALLYTHHCRPISIAAILDVFESVNAACLQENGEKAFDIHLVTDEKMGDTNIHGVYKPQLLSDMQAVDLLLIPAFNPVDMREALGANRSFIPWICNQYQQGAEVASFCTGAFLLASTGLLNGRRATTHVFSADAFSSAFPEVIIEPEAVLTHDAGVYTSGGATSTFHLLLWLIEKHCGRDKAIYIAKLFAIDMDRSKQSYFARFLPTRNHQDDLVTSAQQRMESQYNQSTTVEEIIGDIPSSRRNFVRRFKHATGLTPIEYLQRTRIEAAKNLLEQTNQSVSEIMFHSGYNDMKSFRQVFKKGVGLTPTEYRDKFNAGQKVAARV